MSNFSGNVSNINAMEAYYSFQTINIDHENLFLVDFTGKKSVYFVQIQKRPTVGQVYPRYSVLVN